MNSYKKMDKIVQTIKEHTTDRVTFNLQTDYEGTTITGAVDNEQVVSIRVNSFVPLDIIAECINTTSVMAKTLIEGKKILMEGRKHG